MFNSILEFMYLEFPVYFFFLTLLLVPRFLPVWFPSDLTRTFVWISTQIPCSDSPSPPPGVAQPCIVAPANVAGLTVRSPFDGAGTESQSLFSDNSNFRHPNPIPSSSSVSGFPSSTQSNTDWPTAPEPQSLFTSGQPDAHIQISCVFSLQIQSVYHILYAYGHL